MSDRRPSSQPSRGPAGLLPLLVLASLAFGGRGLAQGTATEALGLPAGVGTQRLHLRVPLPDGRAASLTGARFGTLPREAFAKTGAALEGTPLGALPDGVRAEVLSSGMGFAGRHPELVLEVALARRDSTADLALGLRVSYEERSAGPRPRSGPSEPLTSVLATGVWHKVAVPDDGIYAIDADFLRSIGLSATGGPANVRVYSKGGAMLPERVGDPYPTDLQEVALQEIGNGNGVWDAGERLLFYGESEDVWTYDSLGGFSREENLYAEETNYYITVGGTGLRVAAAAAVAPPSYDGVYTYRARWEEDRINLLKYSQINFNAGQGSGQPFYGEEVRPSRPILRPRLWDLGEIPPGGSGRLRAGLSAASQVSSTRVRLTVGGRSFQSGLITTARWRDANVILAHEASIDTVFALDTAVVDVAIEYPGSPELQRAWIDFVQLTHDAVLRFRSGVLGFRSLAHARRGTYGFSLAGAPAGVEVWDVTDGMRPVRQSLGDGGRDARFGYVQPAGARPREFVAFDRAASYPAPTARGAVANSNIHAITRADYLIVYGEGLGDPAERLADHRRSHGGLVVESVPMTAIVEEFGGGRMDPSAIRNFIATVYARDEGLRYVLLLGDGTYDPRGIIETVGQLVPTFQTKVGNSEVKAFPTDDYFALLDEGEGIALHSYPTGGLDVAVGRIPAMRATDAEAVVAKVIRYDTDPAMRGDWRLRKIFVADDEDSNLHVKDIEKVADSVRRFAPQFNQTKIYVDAFEQVATSGGQRYPAAAEEISRNMFRGNLITTYLGHGGPRGWGLERFLNTPDLERWSPDDALPLLLTATCTFTGFDDPERVVIGEQVLFKRDGGVVGSLSTTRPVYTTSNYALTDATLDELLDIDRALKFSVGELVTAAKRRTSDGLTGSTENDRKFALFGDPAMHLAVPELIVRVTAVDSAVVGASAELPVVAPLREVRLSGDVLGRDSVLAVGFNGEIEITVYDQERVGQTLGQDPGSFVTSFTQIGATLFKGSATVRDGRWEARFMLPVDISLSRGRGRVSLYARAADGRDGAGLFNDFIIDGLAPPAVVDDTPPRVEVFVNTDDFIAGGATGADPVLLARLADDTGINVSGTAIGHDLTAILRGTDEQTYIVNEFYRSATDDYKRGEVRYPVYDLPEGAYELEVRAWDLANNTSTGTTNFVVAADAGSGLRRVLNYPNPFVDATCFQFEHDVPGQMVEVRVDVYTTSGRLVRSLDFAGVAEGRRFGAGPDCISWDGTDDYGQRLARGVYLYKVRLRAGQQAETQESGFERLVVVR